MFGIFTLHVKLSIANILSMAEESYKTNKTLVKYQSFYWIYGRNVLLLVDEFLQCFVFEHLSNALFGRGG